MQRGRPSSYSPETADAICERIANGESVRSIGALGELPREATIYSWILHEPEFAEKYARAKAAQMERMAEEIIEISDDGTNDWMTRAVDGEATEVPNPESVQRSRLRVDSRKWLMSKLAPKKYGDRLETHVTGEVSYVVALPAPAATTAEWIDRYAPKLIEAEAVDDNGDPVQS